MGSLDRDALRRQDFSLDDNQLAVHNAFADFYANESPTSVVRAAEPLGHDKALWAQLVSMGAASMGLPESAGGDGATLLDLVLVAERHGHAVAPAPFISHAVATRLLAASGLREGATGERIVTLALEPVPPGARRLVPDAAIAADVVVYDGETLALHSAAQPSEHVPNQGSTPLGWWQADPGAAVTGLATGERAATLHRRAVSEWKLLTAAALVGMTEAALTLGVEFSKTRETLGVPIGTLQGVAFPLVDVQIGISGVQNLVRKAAWMTENEPDTQPELVPLAFAAANEVATRGTTVAAHVQGGLGFTTEADASLYFLRAKGWGVLAGNPADGLREAAALLIARA
ncbi:acyl-CoA dehydrogenase family protein [Cryptosporangium aurantiacum]|uniref:Acyl-CoA dehydrogenase n=1 Tax=Cryptosporangium aurantiacum TaxID=134849 RepID=A0A1M7Q0U6_9ACTN|nr:acyl-CoA dehydrogenase family protein [Cryptosporangium aurantiacum]SHN23724.1 Acyl-CoA dehydrogenase [Cryptosporangium aurantiacum]